MELVELEHHPLAGKYPVRLPVWWCRTGESSLIQMWMVAQENESSYASKKTLEG